MQELHNGQIWYGYHVELGEVGELRDGAGWELEFVGLGLRDGVW